MHALTFHHVEPTKKRFHITGSHNRSLEGLAAEVAKCVLVCANCHDEIEAGETQLPENPKCQHTLRTVMSSWDVQTSWSQIARIPVVPPLEAAGPVF